MQLERYKFKVFKNKMPFTILEIHAETYNKACDEVDSYLENLDNRMLYSYKNA